MVLRPSQRQRVMFWKMLPEKLIPQVETLLDIGGTAGMSLGVMSHEEVVFSHHFGYADVDKKVVADSSTKYPLGSFTQAFVAVTVAQLVDEGLLDWNEPISKYLPELVHRKDPMVLANELALIDLLSHRTGLRGLDPLWMGANTEVIINKSPSKSPSQLLHDLCARLPSVYPLRSRWLQNNLMYALFSDIIRKVTTKSSEQEVPTKKPYGQPSVIENTRAQAVASRVFQKAGLQETCATSPELPDGSTALPYAVSDKGVPLPIGNGKLRYDSILAPSGGICSSLHDMLILSPFRKEKGPLAGLDVVLSGHSIMNKSISSDELYTLGLAKVKTPAQFGRLGFNPSLVDTMPIIGVESRPHQVFYQNSAIHGYNHCLMLVPDQQLVIVVLTNSTSQGDIAEQVAQTILQAALDFNPVVDTVPLAKQAALNWKTTHTTIAETLEKERLAKMEWWPSTYNWFTDEYTGYYYHQSEALVLHVYEEDDELKFTLNGKSSQQHTLRHYFADTFIFLPSADERAARGLFHYGTHAWLLHFVRDGPTEPVNRIVWQPDEQAPEGEVFVRRGEPSLPSRKLEQYGISR